MPHRYLPAALRHALGCCALRVLAGCTAPAPAGPSEPPPGLDLLDAAARMPAVASQVGMVRVETLAERALAVAGVSEVRIPVTLAPGATLCFDYGASRRDWQAATTTLHFGVGVAEGDGAPQALWAGTVRPYNGLDRNWQHRRVSLEAFAGRAVSLVFTTRVEADPFVATQDLHEEAEGFPAWGLPRVEVGDGRPASSRPDIVWVAVAGLRADRTSLGADPPRQTTPFLAELARQGATFNRAYCQSPWVPASLVSMLTGLLPLATGAPGNDWRLRQEVQTLPQILSRAGYDTFALTVSGDFENATDLHRGFDAVQVEADAYAATAAALGVLERPRTRPAFLFLTLQPYNFPFPLEPHMAQRFGLRDDIPQPDPAPGPDGLPSPGARAYYLDGYDTQIAAADYQLGLLMDELDETDLAARSLVVVTAPSATQLGEHGSYGFGTALYEENLRVPLVMKLPGAIPSGLVYDGMVELMDIAPTTLSLVGLRVASSIQGRDLSPLFRTAPLPPLQGVLAETVANGNRVVSYRTPDRHFVLNETKGTVEVFDPVADPAESRNLLFDKPLDQVADLGAVRAQIEERYIGGAAGDRYLLRFEAAPGPGGQVDVHLKGPDIVGLISTVPPLGQHEWSTDGQGTWKFGTLGNFGTRSVVLLCRNGGAPIDARATSSGSELAVDSVYVGGGADHPASNPFKALLLGAPYSFAGVPTTPTGTPYVRIWSAPLRTVTAPKDNRGDEERQQRLRAIGYAGGGAQ